jgi:hypothetical protein
MCCRPRKERASIQQAPDKIIPSFLFLMKGNEFFQISGFAEE